MESDRKRVCEWVAFTSLRHLPTITAIHPLELGPQPPRRRQLDSCQSYQGTRCYGPLRLRVTINYLNEGSYRSIETNNQHEVLRCPRLPLCSCPSPICHHSAHAGYYYSGWSGYDDSNHCSRWHRKLHITLHDGDCLFISPSRVQKQDKRKLASYLALLLVERPVVHQHLQTWVNFFS